MQVLPLNCLYTGCHGLICHHFPCRGETCCPAQHAGRLHQASGPIREQKLRAGEQAMPGWETSMSKWRGFSAHCGRQYVNHTMQRALCRDLVRDGQGCVELSTFRGETVRSECQRQAASADRPSQKLANLTPDTRKTSQGPSHQSSPPPFLHARYIAGSPPAA